MKSYTISYDVNMRAVKICMIQTYSSSKPICVNVLLDSFNKRDICNPNLNESIV